MTERRTITPTWPLPDRLRKSRQLAGLDQDDLARALGCARTTISNWENGHTELSASHFVRWARMTGVSLEWLAAGVEGDTGSAGAPSWHEPLDVNAA